MEPTPSTYNRNMGTFVHISAMSKYFFPFGNFIFPLIFWLSNRKNSFIDEQGKQCLNFQISTTFYSLILLFIGLFGMLFFLLMGNPENIQATVDSFESLYFPEIMPFFLFIGGVILLFVALFFFDLVCIVLATTKANEGKTFRYPLSIPFIRTKNLQKDANSKKQEL